MSMRTGSTPVPLSGLTSEQVNKQYKLLWDVEVWTWLILTQHNCALYPSLRDSLLRAQEAKPAEVENGSA